MNLHEQLDIPYPDHPWSGLAVAQHRALIDAIQAGHLMKVYYATIGLCHIRLHTYQIRPSSHVDHRLAWVR